MTCLVCGSRHWTDPAPIRRELMALLPSKPTVIHGDCRGADRIAGQIARELGLQVRPFPADWDRFGKRAGPIRNQQMLDDGKPDLVLCFHPDFNSSRGSRDMVSRARSSGIVCRIVGS